MRLVRLLLPAAMAAALLPAAGGQAATNYVVSEANRFAPEQVSIARGDSLELVNVDVAPHNVVSKQAKNGKLLFTSDTITAGQTAVVKGVEALAPGSYAFYCSIHPQMLGTLAVRQPGSAAMAAIPTGGVVASPTSLTFFQDSLYVASYASGTVQKLPVLPGGALGPGTPYVTGLSNPLGVAFAPDGTMFVSESYSGGRGTLGRVRAFPPGGTGAASTVIDKLPNGRHNTNGMVVHKGRLYVANGNSTDDGVTGGDAEEPLSGTIVSVPVGARNVVPGRRELVVEARGMRNPYDVTVRPGTDEVWTATNGPDAQAPYGVDLLHMFDVKTAAPDFGFPGCVYGPNGDFRQSPAPQKCNPKHRKPEALLGLHTSADGLAFGPATGGWNGDLFVARFGSFNGAEGHDIVRVPIVGGHASTPQSVLAAPAPLDLAFGPAGLYVADFSTGQITLLVPVG